MSPRLSSDTLDEVLRESMDATDQTQLKPHLYIQPGQYVPVGIDSPYSQAINDDEGQQFPPKSRTRILILTVLFLILLLAIWTVIATVRPQQAQIQQSSDIDLPCYCGTTISEAQSLNCIYVAMSSAWLPPHCRDDGLAAEFETAGPAPNGTWSYFSDQSMTRTMTRTEVAALAGTETVYYTTWEWHVVHCLFYWRKLHRAQSTKDLTVEPRFNTDAHIHHCAKLILTKGEGDVSTTSGIVLGKEPVPAGMLTARVGWADLRDGKMP